MIGSSSKAAVGLFWRPGVRLIVYGHRTTENLASMCQCVLSSIQSGNSPNIFKGDLSKWT